MSREIQIQKRLPTKVPQYPYYHVPPSHICCLAKSTIFYLSWLAIAASSEDPECHSPKGHLFVSCFCGCNTIFVVVILFLYFVFVSALKYPVNLQKLPEEIGLGHYSLLHPGHQIKGSSFHQRLIVNRIIQFIRQFVIVNLIIDDNYNYLMVGAQIVVVNFKKDV